MAVTQNQVAWVPEVASVLGVVQTVAQDVQAKKAPLAIVSDALGPVITALEGINQMGADFQANKAAVYATAGYCLGQLVAGL